MFDAVASELSEQGWVVLPGFLSPEEARALAAEAAQLKDSFRPAGIGRGADREVNAEIRSDLIHWLDDGAMISEPVAKTLSRLEELKAALNRTLFLGLKEFEGHLAIYPPGARYQKHVDNFRDASPRALSVALYLNEAWVEADHGELRLYDGKDPEKIVVDVEPRAGTLACFLSREIPHEVLPTTRERVSFTGWFRDR